MHALASSHLARAANVQSIQSRATAVNGLPASPALTLQRRVLGAGARTGCCSGYASARQSHFRNLPLQCNQQSGHMFSIRGGGTQLGPSASAAVEAAAGQECRAGTDEWEAACRGSYKQHAARNSDNLHVQLAGVIQSRVVCSLNCWQASGVARRTQYGGPPCMVDPNVAAGIGSSRSSARGCVFEAGWIGASEARVSICWRQSTHVTHGIQLLDQSFASIPAARLQELTPAPFGRRSQLGLKQHTRHHARGLGQAPSPSRAPSAPMDGYALHNSYVPLTTECLGSK